MLLGLAALVLFGLPIAAIIISLSMRSQVTSLQSLVNRLSAELTKLKAELVALRAAKETPKDLPKDLPKDAPIEASSPLVTPAVTAASQVSDPLSSAWGQQAALKVTSEQTSVQAPASAESPLMVLADAAPTSPTPMAVIASEMPLDIAPNITSTVTPAVAQTASSVTPPQAANPPVKSLAQPATKIAAKPVARPAPPPRVESAFQRKLKELLFGGNMVAKIGLLILFFGISFLLKYAATQYTIPIELRLAAVVVADIALLLWAWRIREARPGISLPVQGAALAILMLVTFGAYRLYHLIPSGMAFGLLFVLTVFTCLLAVLQDALWLAVFGIAGGFASPILASSGGGSHIALFSYYALLNAGVFAIALMRSWRLLNLVSFAFTFLIATAWGVTKYVPENYLSSQLFLILFFLFYVAIAIVYAHRQAPQLKNYVDATLVFGTPLVAFGLQYSLVKDMPFGLAFSSLILGVFYVGVSLALWQKRGSSLKMLVESFLALGVVFGTLAIPFALDGRWTSAAWALEGAGIVWIGLRQRQTLTWVFGLVVQLGAWFSFLGSLIGISNGAAHTSNLWLGFLLLAGTAYFMATHFLSHARSGDAAEQAKRSRFQPLATLFLALASLWFIAGAWTEIFMRTDGATQANLVVASALITATGLWLIATRMQWQIARYFAIVVQVVAGLVLLGISLLSLNWPFYTYQEASNLMTGPFLGALLVGCGALFSSWVFQRQALAVESPAAKMNARTMSAGLLAWAGFWWYGVALFELTAWASLHYRLWCGEDNVGQQSPLAAYGVGLALSGVLWTLLARRLPWRELRWAGALTWLGLTISSLSLLLFLYERSSFEEAFGYSNLIFPRPESWVAYAALWLVGEWLMRQWQNKPEWQLNSACLKYLHVVRTAGLWMMIWPLGVSTITMWLHGSSAEQADLLAQAGWFTSGSWSQFLPAWAMMAVLGWLMQRSAAPGAWPTVPLSAWYRRVLLPLGAAWSIFLVVMWNLTKNGAMAPLPYLPIFNPLDLSTCFAIVLGIVTYRMMRQDAASLTSKPDELAWLNQLPKCAAVAVYLWFNLILLRTVAQYGGIPYQFDDLYASQFVQAMLALVWSATALILMRRAVKKVSRPAWMVGVALLVLVVAKLFLVDLSNSGTVARFVSFIGVGLLMVAIGYLAPYPASDSNSDSNSDSAEIKVTPEPTSIDDEKAQPE